MRTVFRTLREYWLPIFLALLALGITVNFVLLVPALKQLKGQARDGEVDRDRQCLLYPISLKLYEGAYEYGIISQADLDKFRQSRPRGCTQVE